MLSLLPSDCKVKSAACRFIFFLIFFIANVKGWKQCDGGGVCPDFATCCPSATPGVSSCISMRYNKDPDDATGECCDEATGCPYGFSCAVRPENPKDRGSVLILAPRFLAPSDMKHKRKNQHQFQNQTTTEFLYWQNSEKQPKYAISHSWRYGADALNAPVSSYEAVDRLVEHLVSFTAPGTDTRCFSNLRQVSIVGHSAGGQLVQRWALLSNAFKMIRPSSWTTATTTTAINDDPGYSMDIRAVVANPRSYCYLNEKRMVVVMDGNSNKVEAHWEVPAASQIKKCPDYNQWTWGLERGGALDEVVPYKARRIKSGSDEEVAHRYANRKVFYLTGEYGDTDQDDLCATRDFQGHNRHERALYYVAALNAYFGSGNSTPGSSNNSVLRHELHTIPETPHDHILMFQSVAGRRAIMELIE
ncbi:unnamed protein product [Cylindrotheca closterium]|uniref:Chlorophyllase n=1 Tax=Cylindrotheca closterium TaxID=2856 RepID=A0AAD2JNN0_9STRA|nr:unnamed protein product [Cylindrotheca closterium]